MSVTIDFAFNANGTLADVREIVQSALGVRLEPYEGDADDLLGRFLGHGVVLVHHRAS